jgi:hypothetical protein
MLLFSSAKIRAGKAYIQNSSKISYRFDKLLVIEIMNYNKLFAC